MQSNRLDNKARLAALLGTTLLSGCALPPLQDLSRTKAFDGGEPVVLTRERGLESRANPAGALRPFHAGITTEPADVAKALKVTTQFRLEYLSSLRLGKAFIELDKEGPGTARLTLDLGKDWNSAIHGKYRLNAVEVRPGVWRRTMEISASAFGKGRAYLLLRETDPTVPGDPSQFEVQADFTPFVPASFLVNSLNTGGVVPVFFNSPSQVRTDDVWAYAVLGNGDISTDKLPLLLDTISRLSRTGFISVQNWNVPETPRSLTQSETEKLLENLDTNREHSFLQFRWSEITNRDVEGKKDPLIVRVLGLIDDRIYCALPPYERFSEHPGCRKEVPGIVSLPADSAWRDGFRDFVVRGEPSGVIGAEKRPVFIEKDLKIAEMNLFLRSLSTASGVLAQMERELGLPPGYFEIGVERGEKDGDLRFETGRFGGLSHIVIPENKLRSVIEEPMSVVQMACRAVIKSIGGHNKRVWAGVAGESVEKRHRDLVTKFLPEHAVRAGSVPEQLLFAVYDPKTRNAFLSLDHGGKSLLVNELASFRACLTEEKLLGDGALLPERLQGMREEIRGSMAGPVLSSEDITKVMAHRESLKAIILRSQTGGGIALEEKATEEKAPEVDNKFSTALSGVLTTIGLVCGNEHARRLVEPARVARLAELFKDTTVPYDAGDHEEFPRLLVAIFSDSARLREIDGFKRSTPKKPELGLMWKESSSVFQRVITEDSYEAYTPVEKMEGFLITLDAASQSGDVKFSKQSRAMVSIRPNVEIHDRIMPGDEEIYVSAVRGMRKSGHYCDRTEYYIHLHKQIRAELIEYLERDPGK